MTATFPLGRILGVRVGLHWSAAGIIALLIAFSLARWPELVPGYGWPAYAAAAVSTALLFIGSLLAHEMAHALVARSVGVEVDGVTLWLLGGIARLRGEALTPGAAFRIAVVGPLASLLAAVVFGLATWAAIGLQLGPLLALTLGYLAVINGIIAVFNLVPAAPLDGGRILRAALWSWRGDRHRAAIWSARAGRVFGIGLIALGVVFLLVAAGADGLWWILIGLFIVTVAGAEEQHAQVGAQLEDMRVGEVMTTNPQAVDPNRTVSDFLHNDGLARRHSAFPLIDDRGGLAGLVTLSRLRAVPAADRDTVKLREAACPPDDVPTARPDDRLTDVLHRMNGCAGGRAVVLDAGTVTGIVTPSDVSRFVAWRGLGVGRAGADFTPGHGVIDRD